MSNKIIVKKALKHYYDEGPASPYNPDAAVEEPDKSKSISELTFKELNMMMRRVSSERELQGMIRDMKRNAGEKDTYDNPFQVDTKTPINQLYHYGILGQKWGIRRFQNEDGTRTPKGKKRDRQESPEKDSKSDDHMKSRVAKSKSPDGLSNDELRELNTRLQLEDTYKKLTAEKMEKSESWVKESIRNAGKTAVTELAKGVFLGSAKLLVKEMSPQFAEVAFNMKEPSPGHLVKKKTS